MARYDKSRPKSQKPNAAVAAPRGRASGKTPAKGSSIEDTMFFPKLRRHAKWMFVFLALVFGLGFVVFGVGAGGTGVGDIFRNNGNAQAQSVTDAQKETEKSPGDPEVWRNLSTALQTEGETDEAIAAFEHVVALTPKSPDAQRELASLYLGQASEKQQRAQIVQVAAAYDAAQLNFPAAIRVDGKAILDDSIGEAVNARATERYTTFAREATAAATNAITAYKKVAALQPDDPNVQIELAQAAEQAGDSATAIAAYSRFLKLAPDDPNAGIVKQQLKRLRAAASG